MKLQLKRSSVLDGGQAKVPTPGQLEYGELAVNYNADDPAVFIKSSTNEVIRITGVGSIGGNWIREGTDLSPYNAGDSLTGITNADFTGNVTIAGTLTANLTGNADTATSANDSENLRGYAPTSNNTGSSIVLRDGSGNFAAGTITANLNGNASTASSATTASNADTADNLYVERDDNSNVSRFLTFTDDANERFHRLNIDSELSYNPATNTLNCNITGTSTNEVSSVAFATTAGQSDTAKVVTSTTSGYKPFVFTEDVPNGAYRELKTDSDASVGIDPSLNKVRADTFEGSATQVYSYNWTGSPPAGGFRLATVAGTAGSNKSIYQDDGIYIGNTGDIYTYGGFRGGFFRNDYIYVSGQSSGNFIQTIGDQDFTLEWRALDLVTTPYRFDRYGNFTTTGNINTTSDQRIKENIEPITDALSKVEELNGVTFNYIEGGKSAGLIAQDVEKILPELVSENEDGIKSVAYGNLVGLLVEAIKELKAEIATMKGE